MNDKIETLTGTPSVVKGDLDLEASKDIPYTCYIPIPTSIMTRMRDSRLEELLKQD